MDTHVNIKKRCRESNTVYKEEPQGKKHKKQPIHNLYFSTVDLLKKFDPESWRSKSRFFEALVNSYEKDSVGVELYTTEDGTKAFVIDDREVAEFDEIANIIKSGKMYASKYTKLCDGLKYYGVHRIYIEDVRTATLILNNQFGHNRTYISYSYFGRAAFDSIKMYSSCRDVVEYFERSLSEREDQNKPLPVTLYGVQMFTITAEQFETLCMLLWMSWGPVDKSLYKGLSSSCRVFRKEFVNRMLLE